MSAPAQITWDDESQKTPEIKWDEPAKTSAPPKPGFFQRLGQSVGVPTSGEEVKAAVPGYLESLATGGVPFVSGARGLVQFGKDAYHGAKEGFGDVREAAENIAGGGPVGANIGKAGYGLLHGELSRLPIIGEPAKTVGQDVAEKNYAGAAGGMTGIAAQVLAPKIAEGVGPPVAEDVVGNLKKVQKPSIKQTGYDAKVTAAVPDLQQIAADNKGNISTPRDAYEAIDNHIAKLEQPMSDAARSLHTSQANMIDVEQPVKSAIKKAFDEKAGAYKPSEVSHATADLEDFIGGNKSLFELENLRRRLNAEASDYYKMTAADRARSGISDASMTAKKAAADALRDQLYGDGTTAGAFENAGMQGDVRGLRQRIGNLLEVRDTLEKAITRAEATGDFSLLKAAITRNPSGSILSGGLGALLGFGIGGPVGAAVGTVAGEGLNAIKSYAESKNPNLNVQKAFGKLERMGVPSNLPEVRFNPPQQIPRMAGQQQPLPMPQGSLFQMGQTPPVAPAAPKTIGPLGVPKIRRPAD